MFSSVYFLLFMSFLVYFFTFPFTFFFELLLEKNIAKDVLALSKSYEARHDLDLVTYAESNL